MIIKKDDSRETYDCSKLEKGILLSCHKRPVSSQEISAVIDEIENQIFNMGEREIPASLIGELVMKKLKDEMCIRDRRSTVLSCRIWRSWAMKTPATPLWRHWPGSWRSCCPRCV